ncbi:hypothetical protein M1494_01960 [Candidatus Parvarchaeota archaeon]|nr:hypothetical protein [Candidatus Parvarchaeota archaeon]
MQTKHVEDKTLERLLSADRWSFNGHFTLEEVDKTIQDFYKEAGTPRALKFSKYLDSYVNDIKELDKAQWTLQDYGVALYSSGIIGTHLKEQGPGLVMETMINRILHDLEEKISAKGYKLSIYKAEKELVNEYFSNLY